MIARAMREIRDKSCVNFVERTVQEDYIEILSDKGCHSHIGRQKGKQTLSLEQNVCTSSMGTIVHELMHVLGFEHEHNRPDRDQYIRIDSANVGNIK